MGDQSIFVKAAISGVAREGVIAAALTSLMILLFLGSWRSTLIIATSIPLAVLGSILGLSALGQTLNIMTLGGLALAVGILVDDATVTIENINWHLEQNKQVEEAILDGAHQIVTPAFVSLLCICIVFVPMFFLGGIAGYLFVPMAEAVMFAMISSFILSRTLVPTMAKYILRAHASEGHASGELEHRAEEHGAQPPVHRNPLVRFQRAFEQRFETARHGYRELLDLALWLGLQRRLLRHAGLSGGGAAVLRPDPGPGRELLSQGGRRPHRHPRARADRHPPGGVIGHLRPHRGGDPPGHSAGAARQRGGQHRPAGERHQQRLSQYRHHRPAGRRHPGEPDQGPSSPPPTTPAPARAPAARIPGLHLCLPAGRHHQPDPELRCAGTHRPAGGVGTRKDENYAYAYQLLHAIARVPGVADARIQQSQTEPTFKVNVDRARAQELGITEHDVTNSLAVSLASSFQVAPAYWLNPKNGISYPIVAQQPQYRLDSLSDLGNLQVTSGDGKFSQVLRGLASIARVPSDAVVSHYDIEPAIDVYATTQNRDLGAVANGVEKILRDTSGQVPKGSQVVLRGQVQTMNKAFSGLLFGLLGALVLIYMVIVVNFQSWADPFVIITALPAALAGIVWMLFATHTTLSVPALTGAIMCMGVATANSILVVSFARERLAECGDGLTAAIDAGFARFRPVCMTALAMIIGMAPMALGLGEGGEQNAPLGRAVIGGLMFATVATLIFVPVVFSMVHPRRQEHAGSSGKRSQS